MGLRAQGRARRRLLDGGPARVRALRGAPRSASLRGDPGLSRVGPALEAHPGDLPDRAAAARPLAAPPALAASAVGEAPDARARGARRGPRALGAAGLRGDGVRRDAQRHVGSPAVQRRRLDRVVPDAQRLARGTHRLLSVPAGRPLGRKSARPDGRARRSDGVCCCGPGGRSRPSRWAGSGSS